MAWICLVESEECLSHCNPGSNQLPIAKSTPIVKECSCKNTPMGVLEKLRSGMIYAPSMQQMSDAELILFMEVSPARTSLLLELEKAWQESEADYFSRSCAWPKKSSPTSYSLKMSQPLPGEVDLRVTKIIAEMGYDCRWCVISAEGLMAPHKRERWFLLAHSNSEPSGEANKGAIAQQEEQGPWLRHSRPNWRDGPRKYWKENKCPPFGMDDGLPFELDRARALGNSVCPQQAREAFKILMGL